MILEENSFGKGQLRAADPLLLPQVNQNESKNLGLIARYITLSFLLVREKRIGFTMYLSLVPVATQQKE